MKDCIANYEISCPCKRQLCIHIVNRLKSTCFPPLTNELDEHATLGNGSRAFPVTSLRISNRPERRESLKCSYLIMQFCMKNDTVEVLKKVFAITKLPSPRANTYMN